ncbi:MAG: redox-regulated ATPase YchF, partial [Candidatus Sungbacteria bacterium]|nr:redox-regulated ATPase YchF [Candidatus Sungbacteria bacterium]
KQVDIANYPFVTIEPNIGIVQVPDERVRRLAELSHSAKKIHAVVEFVDIAGLVKGAAEGQGLGNKFLSHIKDVDAIAEVIRVFPTEEGAAGKENITHIYGTIDPVRDIEIIELELILKDLEIAEARMETLEKNVRAGDKTASIQKEFLEKLCTGLRKEKRTEKIVRENAADAERKEIKILLNELALLTAKPRIFVFNGSEEQVQNGWTPPAELKEKIGNNPWVLLSAKMEDELTALSNEEKTEYLSGLGLEASGLDQLIILGYKTLHLITFLTTGEDETRAWTIPDGSTAPRAGRAIHSDFEEKFIRAEVIGYEKLIEAKSFIKARELGWVRTEGKNYVVKDGDVIEFKI